MAEENSCSIGNVAEFMTTKKVKITVEISKFADDYLKMLAERNMTSKASIVRTILRDLMQKGQNDILVR